MLRFLSGVMVSGLSRQISELLKNQYKNSYPYSAVASRVIDFPAGKSITLDATAEYGYEFLYWFFSSSEIYLDNPLTITPDKNLNISAVFKKKVNHQINITHQNEGEFLGEGNYFDGDTVNLAKFTVSPSKQLPSPKNSPSF